MSERTYRDIDGNPVTLDKLCRMEPAWAANRLRVEIERADKAESALREALEEVAEMREAYLACAAHIVGPYRCPALPGGGTHDMEESDAE